MGIKGHNPLTCSPLFAEIITGDDGEQILRMYEYERIREITYSVSVCLPAGSELLYIQNCVENTSDDAKYSYWWSNIAVPESEKTRIIVPADESFLSSYNEGQYLVDKIPLPIYMGKDLSYPKNSVRSQDFFYKIPESEAKWIAAVGEDGYGLLQLSDRKMIGRKLFVWGQGQGGRHWGEWLSEEGQSYVEIQAGLAYTQLEHIPMAAGECWKWTEAYGAVDCGASAHSSNWKNAQQAVKNAFCGDLEADKIEKMLSGIFKISGNAAVERLCDGSGSGKIADSDMASGFSSVIFLGNDEKGFFTYLDTDEGWQPADIKRMIEYDVKDDEVVIRLRIIDGQPKAWEETETPEGQYEYPRSFLQGVLSGISFKAVSEKSV